MKKIIGNKWDELLADEWLKPYYQELRSLLIEEYREETVYPPAEDIYNALRLTDYDDVKVVILGQDPYHEPGQAHGLAFSVREGTAFPPSLVNILKELNDDLGITMSGRPDGSDSSRGVLDPWARQGVLLLNTSLTVREHQAGSHRGKGWEILTDRIIELLSERGEPMVFILWGRNARSKVPLIALSKHMVLEGPHPSPLSAYSGFFGGKYFSKANAFLEANGRTPIDWSLPEINS